MAAALILSLVAPPVLAAGQDDEFEASVEGILFDLILVRPLGLLAIVVGEVLFVASLPFTAMAGNVDAAAQKLAIAPAEFTFARPLGKFD